MTVSGVPYPEQIFQHFSWACPIILLILLKVYFLQAFVPSLLRSQYSVVVSYVSNLLIFLFVDLVILKTDIWPLIQHFFLLTFFCFSFMYIEAARRNSLAPSISEARLSALTARIRPHFLFNSLNAAISLIRLRPYDAETLLENLANLFRAQLRDGSQNSTLGQEIEWAQEYIAIEQIRMGHTARTGYVAAPCARRCGNAASTAATAFGKCRIPWCRIHPPSRDNYGINKIGKIIYFHQYRKSVRNGT